MLRMMVLYFQKWLRSLWSLPVQTTLDRRLYRLVFKSMAGRGQVDVFEWGSGRSTIYYAKYLRQLGVSFSWDSIDNHAGWCERISGLIKKDGLEQSVRLHLREFAPFWEKPGWDWNKLPPPQGVFAPHLKPEREYVEFPLSLNKKFDVILIDARFRRRCLIVARQMLKPGGVVLMHDAQKPQYQGGVNEYPFSRFYDGGRWHLFSSIRSHVWVGAENDSAGLENLLKGFRRVPPHPSVQ